MTSTCSELRDVLILSMVMVFVGCKGQVQRTIAVDADTGLEVPGARYYRLEVPRKDPLLGWSIWTEAREHLAGNGYLELTEPGREHWQVTARGFHDTWFRVEK